MNKTVVLSRPIKATKTQIKTLKKIEDDLEKEMYKQIGIVSGSYGIALYENWGWREQRIRNFFAEINNIWNEVSRNPCESVLSLCEKETGIEISIPDYEGSYRDMIYFQGDTLGLQLTIDQKIYMRLRQKKWLSVELVASGMVALHRKHGFGYERLNKVYEQMDDVRHRYNWDCKTIEQECYRLTNVDMYEEYKDE